MYDYTQNWFFRAELRKVLLNHIDKSKKNNILEIGCFEGLSACFFSDNIMDNPNSSLTCVDPFYISGTVPGITSENIDENTIKRFKSNISKSKNSNKIHFHNKTSDEFFKTNTDMYNFIYIDGCHEVDYINRDMENSYKSLKKNGIMWMDDYGGGAVEDKGKIKRTMDAFLQRHNGEFELIHRGYQLAIRKLI